MSKLGRMFWCAVVVCGVMASVVGADETVDNPLYKHWSQFKPGSYSVLKTTQTVSVGDTTMATEVSTTTKLKELTSEKAVIEIETVTKMSGQEIKVPAQTMEIPAKITKEKLKAQEEPPGTVKVKEGKEELKVAGKTLKTTWAETEMKMGGNLTRTKAWTCEKVPGQMVKMVLKMEGNTQVDSESVLVKFEAKRSRVTV